MLTPGVQLGNALGWAIGFVVFVLMMVLDKYPDIAIGLR
jgi:hypothetical protein